MHKARWDITGWITLTTYLTKYAHIVGPVLRNANVKASWDVDPESLNIG